MFDEKHPLYGTFRIVKRVAIGIVGGSVLVLGIIMMVTPGPGIAGILAGLAILALEFAWARTWLRKARLKAQEKIEAVEIPYKGDAPATADLVAGRVQFMPPRPEPPCRSSKRAGKADTICSTADDVDTATVMT